jgi:ABC-type proline/glycine betaine transport system permease subunit
MIFQQYCLFPTMNVYDNVSFGLRMKSISKTDVNKRVAKVLEMVDLIGHEKKLIETATLLGANKIQILWNIVIPTSMPWIISGIRIGASVCMVGAIVGEYMGASGGLGWMVTYASSFFQIKRVMSCISVLLMIGLLLNTILERIERYLLRWRSEIKLSINSGKANGINS